MVTPRNDTDAVLDVRAVTKAFPTEGVRIPAIAKLTLSARRGESLAVVGPSGCGKTTLLRILAGLAPPDAGEVRFENRPVHGPTPGIGLVFQEYTRSLFPWLSVWRNVSFGLPRRLPDRATRVSDILDAVGLADRARSYPWQLSGGMQQRVAVARALVMRPSLLLLDEPFGSVDAQTRMTLQTEVSRLLRRLEVTSLLVTHDIDEAVLMGDRVLVLSGRPARIVGEVVVDDLPWPRDPVETKELPSFLDYRRRVFELLDIRTSASHPDDVRASTNPPNRHLSDRSVS